MIIDIIFAVLVVLAIIKGYSRGLIIALFSLVAIIIGLAAAMKLSAVVADRIGQAVKVSEKWLPVISFIVVLLVVVLLIRLGARALQKTAEMAMLGWINRLGGIILYAAIFISVFSIILFYAEKIGLLKASTIDSSITYSFIKPWGPKAINGLGTVLPFFRDMFSDLERFFGNVATKIA